MFDQRERREGLGSSLCIPLALCPTLANASVSVEKIQGFLLRLPTRNGQLAFPESWVKLLLLLRSTKTHTHTHTQSLVHVR